MSAEQEQQQGEEGRIRPDVERTEDQKFHSELMKKLGEEFPNAFRRDTASNGKPVWYIHRPFSLDPIGLNATTRWHLTEDGIIGTNGLVNRRNYSPDTLLEDLDKAKGERFEDLEDERGYYEAGEIEGNDSYGRLLIFDPREADFKSIKDFGGYLQVAEVTGRILLDRKANYPDRTSLENVMDNIRSGAGK